MRIKNLKNKLKVSPSRILLFLFAGGLVACSGQGQFPVLKDVNTSGVTVRHISEREPLSWENSKHPERKEWSEFLQTIILTDWPELLEGAKDMTRFCPSYNSLDEVGKANAWAQLFVSISYFESGYQPTTRMKEPTLGTDPVTQKTVYSEGLLQLSYQDKSWARHCEFNWDKDKHLDPQDSQKSILNPFYNLYCGVGIMARQVKRKGEIILASGAYWAVIKKGGRYEKIDQIADMTKSLKLCK